MSKSSSKKEPIAQPAKDPHCKACGELRNPILPLPMGWVVHWDKNPDHDLYVTCSDECRVALGLPERVPGPKLGDLL